MFKAQPVRYVLNPELKEFPHRRLGVTFEFWEQGAMGLFWIDDGGKFPADGGQARFYLYDRDYPGLSSVLVALATQDVRGRYAEDMVWHVFFVGIKTEAFSNFVSKYLVGFDLSLYGV